MGLANLFGLIFLLSIPALIYIYRFSRKKKRVEISSIIPWRVLRKSIVTSSLFRADLLFFLQLLLLLLLVVAACRPYWERVAVGPSGRHLVIVMDRSASMNARLRGKSRWESARERAMRILAKLRAGDRVTLIGAAARPRVLASAEGNHARLRETVSGLEAADTPDNLGPAVELAVSVMRGEREKPRAAPGEAGGAASPAPVVLYIITDRSAESIGIDLKKKPRNVRHVRVGEPMGNRAITAVSLYEEPFRADPQRSLYATVENFDGKQFIGALRLRAKGKNLQSHQLMIEPGAAETVMLARGLPEGEIEIVLDPPDALRADNRAYVISDEPENARAVLFSRDPNCRKQFRLLASAVPSLELDILSPADYAATDMSRYRLAIFHRGEPEDEPPANLLVIQVPEKSRIVEVLDDWVPGAAFVDWDESHPVGVNLRGIQDVPITGCREVALPPWARPVVISSTTGGDIPLVLCGERGGRKLAVTTFDTAEINFMKPGSMPGLILMLNLLSWLTADEADQITTGQVYETRVPVKAGSGDRETAGPAVLTLEGPKGSRSELRADAAGRVVFYDTDYVGLYRLGGEGVERVFVADLFDRDESDLQRDGGRGDRVEIAGTFSREIAAGDPPDMTSLFFMIALILLMAEWLVYMAHRRGWLKTGSKIPDTE